MRAIKRYSALCLVLLLIGAGGLLLMFDYDSTAMKWAALIGALSCMMLGLYLGHVLNRKNLLPE